MITTSKKPPHSGAGCLIVDPYNESRPSAIYILLVEPRKHRVPVAPATRYFLLVLKITTAQTQGYGKLKAQENMSLRSQLDVLSKFPTHPCMYNVKL